MNASSNPPVVLRFSDGRSVPLRGMTLVGGHRQPEPG